jgi:hypothetical protein
MQWQLEIFEILTPGIGMLRRYRTTHGRVLAIVGSGRSEAASCGPGASSGSNIWLPRLKIQTSISTFLSLRVGCGLAYRYVEHPGYVAPLRCSS